MSRPRKTQSVDPFESLHVWNQRREQEFIGALLYRPEHFKAVAGMLTPDDIKDYRCRNIFAAMVALDARNREIERNSVSEQLASICDDVTRADVLALLAAYSIMPLGTLVSYAQSIRDAASRRRMLRALDDARERLIESDDLEEPRSMLYSALDVCDARETPPEEDRFDAVVMKLGAQFDQPERRPMSTGYRALDRVCGGMTRGSMVLIAARTSVGKTAFATAQATTLAKSMIKTSFMSVEMDRIGIAMRFVGSLAELPMSVLRRRELNDVEVGRFVAVAGMDIPLYTDDRSRSVAQIRARAYQHKRLMGGLDVLFVDYLQLMDIDSKSGERRHEALGRVSRGLKRLAQDLDCVVVALCQVSRAADERPTEPPRLSDLRESGDLEQDADQVWFLWRPPRADDNWLGRLVKIIVAKNREGPTGTADMRFDPTRMQFVDDVVDDDGGDE